ncbi:hypothetical protein [Streptomyces roseolus]|uniref:hypothetical protein n=1 Tax=Streptomyces roseolus TaxID=67358 RepID=UPI0016797A67|nr:hypothetical protein [Streptomyces roseolus]
MLDRWHDAYHAEAPDYANCPYCQDELALTAPTLPLPQVEIDMEAERGVWLETTYDPDVDLSWKIEELGFDPDANPIDRIEELEL